jgi:antitoxin component YwqK of YwqJK toxin-antitoxin module
MKSTYFLFLFSFTLKFCLAQEISIDTTYSNNRIQSIIYKNNGSIIKMIRYNDDQTKRAEFNYKNNLRNGLGKWYYANGNVRVSCMFINDFEYGDCYRYFTSGKLQSKCQYKNGLINGSLTYYYENGKIFFVGNYKKGKLNGELTYYYLNGQIQYVGNFKKDKMSGERFAFDENGNPLNGTVVTSLNNSGSYRKGTYINGKPEGEMKVYSDSSIKLLANFTNGRPDGLVHHYDTQEQDSLIETYKEGRFIKEIKLKK